MLNVSFFLFKLTTEKLKILRGACESTKCKHWILQKSIISLHDEAWGLLVLFTSKFIAKLCSCNKHSMLLLMITGGSETPLASISYAGINEERMSAFFFFFFFLKLSLLLLGL